jgi:CMP-N,N'-diacetyllegionaminic acid synthase
MNYLYLIPARGGSKGIPHKNIKIFNGKPLICYAIDIAKQLTSNDNICVSTDDDEIIKITENYGLTVPFKRPSKLASDKCGTYDVILHALNFYETKGIHYDAVVLLQPTSPFRSVDDVKSSITIFEEKSCEMVVSVKEATTNPYYNCFEENEEGFLRKTIDSNVIRRQDANKVYEYNGAVYVMSVNALKENPMNKFRKIKCYEMDELHSLDLDSMLDWKIAEFLVKEKFV